MSSIEEFEPTLKEVVNTKRISASRMKEVTEMGLGLMQHDTQLVSVLYRTHKSCKLQHKIHSLYVVDSLARAARRFADKHGQTGDVNTRPGNCATFMLKLEGVLDGLFHEMIAPNVPEGKEKSKKILDIWTKNHTFPGEVVTRLLSVVAGDPVPPTQVHPVQSSTPPHAPTNPLPPPAVPTQTPSNATPPIDPSVQSTLLALLSQARNAAIAPPTDQIAPNTSPPPHNVSSQANAQHQLEVNQYKLLQHLSQVAHIGNGNAAPSAHPHPTPLSSSVPSTNGLPAPFMPGPSRQPHATAPSMSSSYHSADLRDIPHHIQPSGDPRQSRRIDGDHDGYGDPRGRFRGGGGPRGRGRGRPWQDDREDYRSRDRSPGSRARSRSPPQRSRYTQPSAGAGHWRDVKSHGHPYSNDFATPQASGSASGKDEFGRDVRPDDEVEVREATQEPVVVPKKFSEEPPIHNEAAASTVHAGGAVDGVGPVEMGAGAGGGLETFDFSTFDFTSPASWAELGRAWEVTNGAPPTQEDLMGFVMVQMGAFPAMVPQATEQPLQQQQWGGGGGAWGDGQVDRGGFRGRGAGRGRYATRGVRGGYGYGNGRETWMGHSGQSDAVVLGGEGVPSYEDTGAIHEKEVAGGAGCETAGGGSGRMQRVGDKWVFVRGNEGP